MTVLILSTQPHHFASLYSRPLSHRLELVSAMAQLLLLLLLLPHAFCPSHAVSPSPIQCSSAGCTISNYQGTWIDRSPCRASHSAFPSSEADLLQAVAFGVRNQLKIKVVSESAHSMSKIACPGGDTGLVISTRDYASNIAVNVTSNTVTVDPGVQLRNMVQEIARYGLTIADTPAFDGASMAGVIATGSHGSGFWLKGSCISEYVVGVRMVIPASEEEGYAKVIELTENDEELKAARISLGVLGAISQVTFSLLPMFKRSTTMEEASDNNLEDIIEAFARKHDFPHIVWSPYNQKMLLKEEDAVPLETEGDGAFRFRVAMPMPVSEIEARRAQQEALERSRNLEEVCKSGSFLFTQRKESAEGFTNDGLTFKQFPVVGLNHRMQSVGGCQTAPSKNTLTVTPTGLQVDFGFNVEGEVKDWLTCNWDPRVRGSFYFHTAISLPFEKARKFILDVKNLRQKNPFGLCSLNMFGGMFIRFVRGSSSYLGEKEDSAVFEFIYIRLREPHTPRLNEDLLEELEQMLVNKYGGKPHWGKNRNAVFGNATTKVTDLSKFLEVRERFDPQGLFSSEWSDLLLGLGTERTTDPAKEDHCALEGVCICSEDRHCSPEKGYFCRPGLVYTEARVCRNEDSPSNDVVM